MAAATAAEARAVREAERGAFRYTVRPTSRVSDPDSVTSVDPDPYIQVP
jgi:hypothetical protein